MTTKARTASIYALLVLATMALATADAAKADQLIEEYRAFISEADLHNSSGDRLTKLAEAADYYDSFFASADNREIVERMIANGHIELAAGRQVVAGGVFVRVRIFGTDLIGKSIIVTVE